MINLTVTDGGKIAEGFNNETNDCAVRALAIATQTPYAEVHKNLKAKGRRDRRGTKLAWITEAVKQLAPGSEEIVPSSISSCGSRFRISYPNLSDTLRKYREGRYVIVVTGHAIAVIDGIVHDSGQIKGGRSRVRRIYRVAAKQQEPKSGITQAQINGLWERLSKLEAR